MGTGALAAAWFIVLVAGNAAADGITRETWGRMVGFAPEDSADPPKPGTVVDDSNLDGYSALVPEPIRILVKKYHLRLPVRETAPYAPSDGYIAATNKHRGTAKLVDTGGDTTRTGLGGYVAGLPFPNPKDGSEVAWNFFHAYHGDDGRSEFSVYWISANKGVERNEVWRWTYIVNTMHRTDLAPIPRMAKLADDKIAATSLTETLSPLDRKGQMALYNVYDNPNDREGWVYIPAQKRTMRFISDTHGEAWNNTDLLYEDIRGYSGRPEWMNWKILAKTTMLAPMGARVELGRDAAEKTYDFKESPHWNPKLAWQVRPVYVVELTPKFPKYPYSRQILYVDAEMFIAHAKVAYDAKGQLWKIMVNATNDSPDPKTKPLVIATSFLVDLQAEHATVFPWHASESNVGVSPDLFSLTTLRKNAR